MIGFIPDLIRRGADVNDRDRFGQTPLMTAVLRGSAAGVRALLRHGADPLARDDQGATIVHHLVAGVYAFSRHVPHDDSLALLRELLSLGVDPHAAGPYGRNALTVAAEKDLPDALGAMIEAGARPDRADAAGYTPLQAAAVNGCHHAARALLSRGVPLDFISAVALGSSDEVVAQIERDPALANAVFDPMRTSALSLAIRYGHAALVRVLLRRGADPDGPDRWTSSLHSATRHLPDPAIVRDLLERGANVGAADADGLTVLASAAGENRIEIAKLLLEFGADPNAETERGCTVLHCAASDEMRNLLRAHGGR
jgi:ankyrin repeat protein